VPKATEDAKDTGKMEEAEGAEADAPGRTGDPGNPDLVRER
jgi:hypothetical protein